jgi:hypothetical protein
MATFNVLVTPFDWELDSQSSQVVSSEEGEDFEEMVGRLEYDVVKQAPVSHAAYLVTSQDGSKCSIIISNEQLLNLLRSRLRDEIGEEDDDEGVEGDEGDEGDEDETSEGGGPVTQTKP